MHFCDIILIHFLFEFPFGKIFLWIRVSPSLQHPKHCHSRTSIGYFHHIRSCRTTRKKTERRSLVRKEEEKWVEDRNRATTATSSSASVVRRSEARETTRRVTASSPCPAWRPSGPILPRAKAAAKGRAKEKEKASIGDRVETAAWIIVDNVWFLLLLLTWESSWRWNKDSYWWFFLNLPFNLFSSKRPCVVTSCLMINVIATNGKVYLLDKTF